MLKVASSTLPAYRSLHPRDRDEWLDRPELGIAGNQDSPVFHGGCIRVKQSANDRKRVF